MVWIGKIQGEFIKSIRLYLNYFDFYILLQKLFMFRLIFGMSQNNEQLLKPGTEKSDTHFPELEKYHSHREVEQMSENQK
jgi:hypothetical protein